MDTDYITNGNTIIFSPGYNKPLSLGLNAQAHYKKIIFSGYELQNWLFETHDEIFETYMNNNWNHYKSKFNQSLANSLDNCSSLTHIMFGYDFNQPLSYSLSNCTLLTHIVFGHDFNCPLLNSLDNCTLLTYIVFGYDFNQPLSNSLNNCTTLTHIIFGVNFNQHLTNCFDNCTALTHIEFSRNFNQPLVNSLDVCTALTHIDFGFSFNQPLTNSLDNLPFLTHLGLGFNFNQKLDLPLELRSLSLNSNNGNYGDYLPDTIEELELGLYFNLELDNCPSSIKKITFDKNSMYNKKLNCLPNGLLILELPAGYDQQISLIPSALTKIICSKKYKFINDFTGIQVETY